MLALSASFRARNLDRLSYRGVLGALATGVCLPSEPHQSLGGFAFACASNVVIVLAWRTSLNPGRITWYVRPRSPLGETPSSDVGVPGESR